MEDKLSYRLGPPSTNTTSESPGKSLNKLHLYYGSTTVVLFVDREMEFIIYRNLLMQMQQRPIK